MGKRTFSIILSLAVLLTTAVLFNNCQAFEALAPLEEREISLVQAPISQLYFQNSLQPALENSCAACHAQGGIGPVSIFNFTNVQNWIEQGASDKNNYLFNKMNAILTHGGGDLCPADNDGLTSPCLEVKTFSLLEQPLKTDGIAGQALEADSLGRVKAWILDPLLPEETLEAHVYIGASVEAGGTLVGTYTANAALIGNEYGDGHSFSFQIPEAFRDGLDQDIYIYGRTAEAANLVSLMPVKRSGFVPNPLGRTYFDETLLPLFTSCMECHADMNYDLSWFSLASPKPFTGTADNNYYINSLVGPSHAGLDICNGDKTQEPCASVQAWWRIEFESL